MSAFVVIIQSAVTLALRSGSKKCADGVAIPCCELLRVFNRGEAVNALKRAIYTGRIASHQAKQSEEMQAVADALSLLANIVMAWNTAQMQQVLDHWAQRRGGVVPPELIGRIAPTRTEGINLRGVFRFPVERCADKILPSATAVKTPAGAS
jgi:Tn3 transposase DDE domain